MTTDKYNLHTIEYSVQGWDTIMSTDMSILDSIIHTNLLATLGESVSQYEAVGMFEGETKYKLAVANAVLQPAIGLALAFGVDTDEVTIQRIGPITNAGWSWTIGNPVYLDGTTPGALTQTEPNENVQIIGIAISATTLFLNPIITRNKVYELKGHISTAPTSSLKLISVPISRSVNFPADLPLSLAYAYTTATASTVFDLKNNGASFGTLTFLPDTNPDNAAAVDKGGGKVGIPVTGHALSVGQKIIISGSVSYDDTYLVDTDSTTNEIVIVASYTAETFTGSEDILLPWGFFVCASTENLSIGDLLTLTAPASADATLADINWSIVGSQI